MEKATMRYQIPNRKRFDNYFSTAGGMNLEKKYVETVPVSPSDGDF
jgi:hypothetical protein